MKIFMILFCLFSIFFHQKTQASTLQIQSDACILMDMNSSRILYEKNGNKRYYPASMTKMMTLLLTLEAIQNKTLTWNQELVTSKHASQMGGSQIYLAENEVMKVKDLFKSVVIGSANDASVVFAEKISGSHKSFVDAMNAKAKRLNMNNTHFENATGLHDPNHYSTPNDMALLAHALLQVMDGKILEYSSLYDAYVREDSKQPFWLVNTNKLLKQYPGVDGLKSGFTQPAGYCFTITAQKDHTRMICVVMKASTPDERMKDIITLLDYGFSLMKNIHLFDQHQYMTMIEIQKGTKSKVKAITKQNVDVSVLKSVPNKIQSIDYEIIHNIAPIKKGEVIAKAHIKLAGDYTFTIDLISNENIKALAWIDVLNDSIIKILAS